MCDLVSVLFHLSAADVSLGKIMRGVAELRSSREGGGGLTADHRR